MGILPGDRASDGAGLGYFWSSDKKTGLLGLTWQDLEVLESVDKALNCLVEFTDALLGEDNITVSYVKPMLHLYQSS